MGLQHPQSHESPFGTVDSLSVQIPKAQAGQSWTHTLSSVRTRCKSP